MRQGAAPCSRDTRLWVAAARADYGKVSDEQILDL